MPQVDKLLRRASEHRAVAETKCNDRSSRSHSVFTLKINGANTITEEKCSGKVNFYNQSMPRPIYTVCDPNFCLLSIQKQKTFKK